MSIRYGRLSTKAIVFAAVARRQSRPNEAGATPATGGKADPRRVAPGRRMTHERTVYVVGTADTKGEELAFLAARVREAGGAPLTVDVGTRAPTVAVDVPRAEVAARHPERRRRGARPRRPRRRRRRHGRGLRPLRAQPATTSPPSSASAAAAAPRSSPPACATLPFGVPKLMVSTLASGDVAPYVGVSDIAMMPSVADIAGLNRISRVGARQRGARDRRHGPAPAPRRRRASRALGLTMFGVTTPCVTQVAEAPRRRLRLPRLPRHRHRRAHDGEARRQRRARRRHRRHDHRGLRPAASAACSRAGPDRLGAIARTPRPLCRLVGALDMVNFWALGHRARALPRPQPLPAQPATSR